MIIVLIMMLEIIMRKYSLSILMKTDVKQIIIVKHNIIYPAVTEFFLRNVHILVA